MMYEYLIEALRMGADYGVEEESVGKLCADAAAAIEALQAEAEELKRVNMELYEDLPKYGEQMPHWVSVKEPPKENDTVLVRDNGYRVLTYLGHGRWEDDYGYWNEFVSDDAEWSYIEPPQEVQK